jgi:hypothetical protein
VTVPVGDVIARIEAADADLRGSSQPERATEGG